MEFEIYRDRMIIIIKRSLYGVTFGKKWCKIFTWEKVGITRKTKIIKPEFMRDTWEFDWPKSGNMFDWHRKHIYGMFYFKISILFIVYIGAEHIKLCLASRARNLVLFCFYFSTTAIAENFCYSQCKIQETVSQCKTQETVSLILTKKIWSCFEKKNEIHNWIIFDTWSDTYMKRYR